VRTKTIMLGAIAALALATLSANAGNPATSRAQGSVVSLVAATAAVARADREAALAGAQSATHEEAVQKPVVATKPAALKVAVSADCQTAINNLKALRQADVAEDASEKANPSATDPAEDKTEAGNLRNALTAVRTACLPQPSAACQTALASLKALRDADVTEDASEKAGQTSVAPESAAAKAEDIAETQGRQNAEMAVRTACGEREGERDGQGDH
jgi:hypothetical protein